MVAFQDIIVRIPLVTPLVLVTISLLGAYLILRRNPRLNYHLSQIGGPPSIPVLGVALSFLRPHNEFIKMFEGFIEKYGLVFGFWIGNFIPYVFIADAVVIEKIISSTSNLDKGKFEYSMLHDWLGTGLLTAPRKKWTHRRKLLTPSFHFKILEDFIPIFNEQTSVLLECLEKRNKKEPNQTMNIYPYIMNCALDIICETAMGKKVNAQTGTKNKKYIDAVNGMCSLVMDKSLKPWFRVPVIYSFSSVSKVEMDYLKTMKDFTKQVIKSRQNERKDKINNEKLASGKVDNEIEKDYNFNDGAYGKRRKAFLDLLLDASENGTVLNDADIQEEVDTFMFEGHDTTGVSLAWTILLLASNPKCQKSLQEELDQIFEDDPTRDVSTADLTKMKYLECCLKESLRLYPSVPVIMRQVDNDIPLENGKLIPQGATAGIAIYFAHRNPKYFPEPEKFKPERFYAENQFPKRHPFSYIPFSAGPRNCIGQKFALMEEKVVLAKLFQAYEIEAVDKMEDVRMLPDVVLRCENGINVKIRKRNQFN